MIHPELAELYKTLESRVSEEDTLYSEIVRLMLDKIQLVISTEQLRLFELLTARGIEKANNEIAFVTVQVLLGVLSEFITGENGEGKPMDDCMDALGQVAIVHLTKTIERRALQPPKGSFGE